MKEEEDRYPTWRWIVGITIALIAFFIVRGIDSLSADLVTAQVRTDKQQEEMQRFCDRVTRLETQYEFISQGIEEIKKGQREMYKELKDKSR